MVDFRPYSLIENHRSFKSGHLGASPSGVNLGAIAQWNRASRYGREGRGFKSF